MGQVYADGFRSDRRHVVEQCTDSFDTAGKVGSGVENIRMTQDDVVLESGGSILFRSRQDGVLPPRGYH